MASEMPVLPDVGSRIVAPGLSRPSFSARWIIHHAGRSFTDPVGLRSSSLAHSRTSGVGDNLGSPTSGVPPTEARRLSKRMSAARDGREYDDLVAVAELGLETPDEPDVLVVDVDVDEAPQVTLLDEALLDAGVVRLQVVDQRGERATLGG